MDKRATTSAYSVFKRIANLLIVIGGVILCLNVWLYNQGNNQQTRQALADQLGHSLIGIGKNALAQDLAAEDRNAINQFVVFLAADPQVQSAAVYRPNGTLLSESDYNRSIVSQYRQPETVTPRVYVEEIYTADKMVGYVRLVLDEKAVMLHHEAFRLSMLEQGHLLFFLGIAFGGILTRAFYKLRYKNLLGKLNYKVLKTTTKNG